MKTRNRKHSTVLVIPFVLLLSISLTSCYTGNFGQWIPGRRPTIMKNCEPRIEISPEFLWNRLVSGYYLDCKISLAQTTTVTWIETKAFRMFEVEGITFVAYPPSPSANDFNFIAFSGYLKSKENLYGDIMSLGRDETVMKIDEAKRNYSKVHIHVEFGGFFLGMNKQNARNRILENAKHYSCDAHDRHIMEMSTNSFDKYNSIGSRSSNLQNINGLVKLNEIDFLECWTPSRMTLLAHLGLRGTKCPIVAEGKFVYSPARGEARGDKPKVDVDPPTPTP